MFRRLIFGFRFILLRSFQYFFNLRQPRFGIHAVIVPTRSRSLSIKRMIVALELTKTNSDIFFVIDSDEPNLLDYIIALIKYRSNKTFVIVNFETRGIGVVQPLNFAARKIVKQYKILTFLGDDNIPRTTNWDKEIEVHLLNSNYLMCYPRDGLRNESLPTVISMKSELVSALNGFAPENFTHLYVDNFWLYLGQKTDAIIYLQHVFVEHMHPVKGGVEYDDQYRFLNSNGNYELGKTQYSTFINSPRMFELIAKFNNR